MSYSNVATGKLILVNYLQNVFNQIVYLFIFIYIYYSCVFYLETLN